MSAATPTPREVVLVVLLLAALISFSKSNFDFTFRRRSSPSLSGVDQNSSYSFVHSGAVELELVPQTYNTWLSWAGSQVPQTKVIAHVPGWTVFDKLYILNGTIYVVSDDPDKVPDINNMISKGVNIENGAAAEAARLPTDREMRIISTKEAKKLFGTGAQIIDGVSYVINDPFEFITHYYHWSAELWFGLWRTYSSLDPYIASDGTTTLPPPRRLMFIHLDAWHWRDYASMNQWVLRSSFPGTTAEYMDDWRDRAELGRVFVFDRVVFADRSAAMRGFNFMRTQRTAAEPFALPGSVNWWMTIRSNMVRLTGLLGSTGHGTTVNPVITYVSRQEWGRRMLIPADHDRLVAELYKLRDTYGYEVNVVSMDKLSRVEQLRLAARTTIMMGVHGNGLTALLWMKPSPRSTVMEFFFPGGFAHDYEYTTRALGMVHYGFWGSVSFTSPAIPQPKYVEGFQGNAIPIDGAEVARLCVDRLTLAVETDD